MVIKLMMIEEEKRMNILFTIGIIGTIGLFANVNGYGVSNCLYAYFD